MFFVCICVLGENVEVAINYVFYVVVKRVIGQFERNAVVFHFHFIFIL